MAAHRYFVHISPRKVIEKTEDEFIKYILNTLVDADSPKIMVRDNTLYRQKENPNSGDPYWEDASYDIQHGWFDLNKGEMHLALDMRIVELACPEVYYDILHTNDGLDFWLMGAIEITKHKESANG